MDATERKYLGLDDDPTTAEKLLVLVLLGGSIYAMKKISDICAAKKGQKQESWLDWLTR